MRPGGGEVLQVGARDDGCATTMTATHPPGSPPMKIKHIAMAALVPATAAGIALSSWPAHTDANDASARVADGRALSAMPHHATAAGHRSPSRPAGHPLADSARRIHAGHHSHARPGHHVRPGARRRTRASSLFTGMSAFERCVAWRESGDNPAASSAGLFGILPATWASLGYPGTAGQASVALQKAAFNRLYAQDGTRPWAAYDGC